MLAPQEDFTSVKYFAVILRRDVQYKSNSEGNLVKCSRNIWQMQCKWISTSSSISTALDYNCYGQFTQQNISQLNTSALNQDTTHWLSVDVF